MIAKTSRTALSWWLVCMFAVCAWAQNSAPSQTAAQEIQSDRRDANKDSQEIRADRADRNQLVAQVNQLRQRLHADEARFGTRSPQAREDRAQLHSAEAQLKKMDRDLKGDWRDDSKDHRNLRKVR
jgi:septal ring factor EnvC (AmiA/AmiB activator)